MGDKSQLVEQMAIQGSEVVVRSSAVLGLVSWIAEINWVGLFTILIAVAGLWVNKNYQQKRNDREAAESEARMRLLMQQIAQNEQKELETES